MKHAEISKAFAGIKSLIMKGKTNLAISELGVFIASIGDEDLEDQIISLSSRYNRLSGDKVKGIISTESSLELNTIESSLMILLRGAKQTAAEEASFSAGEQLSELAEEGGTVIEELKKLNVIMAEARLLELKVIRQSFGSFFSEKDSDKFDEIINELNKVLNREGDNEDVEISSANLVAGVQNHPLANELRGIMSAFLTGGEPGSGKEESSD